MGLSNARGRAAEAMAVAYLELVGCRVLARNTKVGGVEVDAVVDEDRVIVLVEVKYRSNPGYGGAAAAIDGPKRDRLRRAASVLVSGGCARVRIDAVTIDLGAGEARVRHFRNAITE